MELSFIKKNLRISGNKRYEKRERDPERDWRILLAVALALCGISISLAMYIYINAEKKNAVEPSGATAHGILNEQVLRETITRYEGKAKELELLKGNRINTADPSQ